MYSCYAGNYFWSKNRYKIGESGILNKNTFNLLFYYYIWLRCKVYINGKISYVQIIKNYMYFCTYVFHHKLKTEFRNNVFKINFFLIQPIFYVF